ncbi:lipopolysaccharide biosynthesis protein [Marinobacter sp. F4218]|uniref:lipopolysaccharide biosynthesis protein n=1 Tax=Marinobacter sp. F4218 TaxID=2862868 RepID=UPI001C635421|nr:lipopolysaccharide biosynthesis protein [Marinobacter sp. F4218]MBW7470449.1 lipopolysaccharide biosynthesis protein [Marinobacter sp. F4218]
MSRELSRSLLVNTLWSFVGRFGYLAVGLITNIILVRLLSPKEFGQVGIIMFFIVVASVLTESGLSGALVRKQNATEVDYSTIFIFNLVVSLTLMTLFVASSGFIADFYEDSNLKEILIVSSFVLLINALRVTQATKLIKNLQFKKKAGYEFLAILLASIIAVVLAFNGAGVWALVALQLSSAAILTVLLWLFVGPLRTYQFSVKAFTQFYKFGINTTLSSLLNTAFDNVYQLILGKYFSITQAGYFYQAKKLQEMPTGVLQGAMLGVVYSTLAKLQNRPMEFNALYQSVVRVFTIIVALICMLIFYYSELIITVLYGDKWVSAVFYLQMLIIASFFYLQEMFNRIVFKVFDKTENILKLEIFKKILQTFTIVYGIWTMSIENLLYGFVATSVISFFINYHFARKVQNHYSWGDFFVVVKVMATAIGITFSCDIMANYFHLKGFYTLAVLPVFLLLYFSCLRLLQVCDLYYDLKAFKEIITGSKSNA